MFRLTKTCPSIQPSAVLTSAPARTAAVFQGLTRLLAVFGILQVAAGAALAQPEHFQVFPASPTTQDSVVVTIPGLYSLCKNTTLEPLIENGRITIVTVGFQPRTCVGGTLGGPPPLPAPSPFLLGPLKAGDWTLLHLHALPDDSLDDPKLEVIATTEFQVTDSSVEDGRLRLQQSGSNSLRVTVTGNWDSTCEPSLALTSTTDDEIRLELVNTLTPFGTTCEPASLREFTRTLLVGQLPFGTYAVTVERLNDDGSREIYTRGNARIVSDPSESGGIRVEPENPTDSEEVRILVWDREPLPCRSELARIDRSGDELLIHATRTCEGTIPRDFSSHAFSVSLGALKPGRYFAEVRFINEDEDPTSPPTTHAAIEFDVSSQSAPISTGNGRFQVQVTWQDFEGGEGFGREVFTSSRDDVLVWFFDPSNPEMLIKVLDGCAINDHHWVLLSAATDVAYEIEIRDVLTGEVWRNSNSLGTLPLAVSDVLGFSASCNPG